MSERATLEVEVSSHRERVEQILAALREIEDSITQAAAPANKLLREADLLRIELRGREAAVQLGSARLRMIGD